MPNESFPGFQNTPEHSKKEELISSIKAIKNEGKELSEARELFGELSEQCRNEIEIAHPDKSRDWIGVETTIEMAKVYETLGLEERAYEDLVEISEVSRDTEQSKRIEILLDELELTYPLSIVHREVTADFEAQKEISLEQSEKKESIITPEKENEFDATWFKVAAEAGYALTEEDGIKILEKGDIKIKLKHSLYTGAGGPKTTYLATIIKGKRVSNFTFSYNEEITEKGVKNSFDELLKRYAIPLNSKGI